MAWRRIFRWALAVGSFPSLPVAYLNIEKLAESWGWDSLLVDAASASTSPTFWGRIMDFLISPIMALASVAILSLTLGMWFDTWLRQREPARPKRAERLKAIGYDCEALGARIHNYLNPVYASPPRQVPADLVVAAYAQLLTLEKEQVAAPTSINLYNIHVIETVSEYLKMVGRLLAEGHNTEAEIQAIKITKSLIDLSESPQRR